jgi:hypothetical protein
VVDHPLGVFTIVVPLLAEEQNLGGGSNADSLIVEQLHLAELKVVDVLISIFLKISGVDCESVPLPVEDIYLVFLDAEKALVWKIGRICIINEVSNGLVRLPGSIFIVSWHSNNSSQFYVPKEVIVHQ